MMLRSCGARERASHDERIATSRSVGKEPHGHYLRFVDEAVRSFRTMVNAAEEQLVRRFNQREQELITEISALRLKVDSLVHENAWLNNLVSTEETVTAQIPDEPTLSRSRTHSGICIESVVNVKSTPRPKLLSSIKMMLPPTFRDQAPFDNENTSSVDKNESLSHASAAKEEYEPSQCEQVNRRESNQQLFKGLDVEFHVGPKVFAVNSSESLSLMSRIDSMASASDDGYQTQWLCRNIQKVSTSNSKYDPQTPFPRRLSPSQQAALEHCANQVVKNSNLQREMLDMGCHLRGKMP